MRRQGREGSLLDANSDLALRRNPGLGRWEKFRVIGTCISTFILSNAPMLDLQQALPSHDRPVL